MKPNITDTNENQSCLTGSFDLLEHCVLFGLFSFFVLPQITVAGYGVYIGTIIAPFILILTFSLKINKYVNNLLLFFLVFAFFITISNFFGYSFLSVPSNYRDFIELVKIIQFLPYLYAVKKLKPNKFLKLAFTYMKIGTLIFILMGYIQFFNVPFWGEFLTNFYTNLEDSLGHGKIALSGNRIIATGSDPNTAASICIFLLAYNFFNFKSKNQFNFKLLINSSLLLILLLFTQSRTGLLAFIFACILYILFVIRRSIRKKTLMIAAIFIVFPLIIYTFNFNYIYLGFRDLLYGTNMSILVRFSNLMFAVEKFVESPILGWGVAKSMHPTTFDSEYSQVLLRFGITGILSVFLFYYFIIKQLFNNFAFDKKEDFLFSTYFFVILTSLITMITNSVLFGYQFLSIIVLCYIMNIVKRRALAVYSYS